MGNKFHYTILNWYLKIHWPLHHHSVMLCSNYQLLHIGQVFINFTCHSPRNKQIIIPLHKHIQLFTQNYNPPIWFCSYSTWKIYKSKGNQLVVKSTNYLFILTTCKIQMNTNLYRATLYLINNYTNNQLNLVQ